MCKVGQNRLYTPHMTLYLVTSLPKTPYTGQYRNECDNPKIINLNVNNARGATLN